MTRPLRPNSNQSSPPSPAASFRSTPTNERANTEQAVQVNQANARDSSSSERAAASREAPPQDPRSRRRAVWAGDEVQPRRSQRLRANPPTSINPALAAAVGPSSTSAASRTIPAAPANLRQVGTSGGATAAIASDRGGSNPIAPFPLRHIVDVLALQRAHPDQHHARQSVQALNRGWLHTLVNPNGPYRLSPELAMRLFRASGSSVAAVMDLLPELTDPNGLYRLNREQIVAIASNPRGGYTLALLRDLLPELTDPEGLHRLNTEQVLTFATNARGFEVLAALNLQVRPPIQSETMVGSFSDGLNAGALELGFQSRSVIRLGPQNAAGTEARVPAPSLPVDTRPAAEIARTRETHQSRRLLGMDDLPALRAGLGTSGDPSVEQRQTAQSYAPRLEQAEAEIARFLEQVPGAAQGQATLDRFRTVARDIEADLEDDHTLDSPQTRILTADYNQIMEALRTLYRRIPSEPGHHR